MSEQVIVVPNVLGKSRRGAEAFILAVSAVDSSTQVVLSMENVKWVCPYGAVMLLAICRYRYCQSGGPVVFRSMRNEVHAYLRRIDFFEQAGRAADQTDGFHDDDDLSRSSASYNVLELFTIRDYDDVECVVDSARRILERWLGSARTSIDKIVILLSEACGNIVAHSRDSGVVTIQKYEPGCVELAISDMGIGIPESLRQAYGDVGITSSDYIQRAIEGLSERGELERGMGLDAIKRIATADKGNLYIRSETGAVFANSVGTHPQNLLAHVPGTHIGITFRSRHEA